MISFMVILSISLSIDALGIGISYRLKGVKITVSAKIIIGIISALIMLGSVVIGNELNKVLPKEVSHILGIAILIFIGVSFIRNSLFGGEDTTYDLDKSRKIEGLEAVLLAIALSADSISAGIAAASSGLTNHLIAIFVGLMQIIFLQIGESLVEKADFFKKIDSKICGIISGFILILIAILRWISL